MATDDAAIARPAVSATSGTAELTPTEAAPVIAEAAFAVTERAGFTASFRDSIGESDELLREAARILPAPLPPPDLREGHLVARRYRLESRLGRGGYGEVWRALDRLSGADVAIKLLRRGSAEQAARACREVAALRLLRLPGVVRLADEGVEDEHPYLVMALVPGLPFPGVPFPCPWSQLREPLLRLLEILGRVHAAGFVHRDLKPENVLVDGAGHPVLLDFGIARARSGFARITGAGAVIGTLAFVAPEQLGDRAVTERTDLYAAGVMAFLALSGRLPHDVTSFAALVDARLDHPAPPLRSFEPAVPEGVARVIDQLLAIDPEDRPRSAAAAVALLRAADPPPIEGPSRPAATSLLEGSSRRTDTLVVEGPSRLSCAARSNARRALPAEGDDAPWTEAALRELFAGPDRVLHLREDAARILLQRTRGVPTHVRREIDAWVGAGLAHWSGDLLATDRSAIEQLQDADAGLAGGEEEGGAPTEADRRAEAERMPVGATGRLQRLLSLGEAAGTESIAAEALASADRLLRDGAVNRAAAHATEGLFALRRSDRTLPEALSDALSTMVQIAFADGAPPALDRALYELCRPGPTSPLALHLVRLFRAALAVEAWTERAADLVEAVPPFTDVRLERLRQGVRVEAARRVSVAREEAVLAEVEAWAEASGDAVARASHAHWLGRLRYCQNRFEEATRAHDEAARLCDWPPLRAAALFFAGTSALETFDLDAAGERANAARALAAGTRQAFFEMLSEWLLRLVAYRAGRTDGQPPDLELCTIAPALGSASWEGAILMAEATVAYRNGDRPTARDLAGRALRAYGDSGHPIGSILSRGIHIAAGGPASAEEITGLAGRARACPVPEVGLQCLALLAEANVPVEATAAELRSMAGAIRPEHRGRRLDVFSIDEALARLEPR